MLELLEEQRETLIPLLNPKTSHILHNLGSFHLSELTGQIIPVIMRISLLIKVIRPDQFASGVFQLVLELFKKAYFIVTMIGLAKVWLASSGK